MKNISENRRGEFEQAWQDAFDGKEMSPSPDVWQNLDRHLANQESKKYRKGIFVYKWIAAASIAMALVVSGIYFYNTYTGATPRLSDLKQESESTGQENRQADNGESLVDTQDPVAAETRAGRKDGASGISKDNVKQEDDRGNVVENSVIGGEDQPAIADNQASAEEDTSEIARDKGNQEGDRGNVVKNNILGLEDQPAIAENQVSGEEDTSRISGGNVNQEGGRGNAVKNSILDREDQPAIADNQISREENTSGVAKDSVNRENDQLAIAKNNSQQKDKTNLAKNISDRKDGSAVNRDIASGDRPAAGTDSDRNERNQTLAQSNENNEATPDDPRSLAFNADEKASNRKDVGLLARRGADLEHLEHEAGQLVIQKVINFGDDPFRKKADNMAYDEDLWAGINVASGYFNPNFDNQAAGPVAANAFVTPSRLDENNSVPASSVAEDNSGGQSFSFGFSVGKRVAKRWVLQSGLNYLNHTSDGSTNAFYELSDQSRTPATAFRSVEDAESLNLASSVINFDNQFEFLSVPVTAGYVLVDKKVSLVLSAGVGTDFFLRNNVSPDNEGIEDFSVSPGEASPYRTVYFNGLMGTQLRYRFSKHYSFTFEPSYSIAINSFSKSNSDLNSFPDVFRIGVGLKYHFR